MRTHDETVTDGVAHRPAPASASSAARAELVASRLADPAAVIDLQRSAGNAAVVQLLGGERDGDDQDGGGQPSPVLDVVGRGGGEPMEPATRRTMESALGADFSGVRVHTDSAASASAAAVQAHAYTVGDDVVFQRDLYRPDTAAGQKVLAHELTHVVQQRSGPVDGTDVGGGIKVSDPSDRFEQAAEASAERVVAGGPALESSSVQRHGADLDASAVQRDEAMEEEEPVQAMTAQREEEMPEEEEMTS